MDLVTFTLLECTLTLYPVQADGTLGSAIWSGTAAENLTCRGRWISVETRPTGSAHPKTHPLVAQYSISIGRLFAVLDSTVMGFVADHQEYVLDVTWTDEDSLQWHRRTFYGVRVATQDQRSRGMAEGFDEDQEFTAEYFVPSSGQGVAPTADVPSNPLVVYWRGNDGWLALYTHADGVYTAVDESLLTGRASVAADGSGFTFATGGTVLSTSAGGITVPALVDVLPSTLPRLEFYRGRNLLAALGVTYFWCRNFSDGTLPAGAAGQFHMEHSGSVVAVVEAGRVTAKEFTAG